MPTSFSIETLPDLNNRDISLLYDIVALAQRSKQRPVKALFSAYEQILEERGADTDHDSKYFRFLSHTSAELAKDGSRGLVKRFQRLFLKAGVQIVLEENDDQEGADDGLHLAAVRERRRASFNDSNLDATWLSRHSEVNDVHDGHHQRRVTSDNERRPRQRHGHSGHPRSHSAVLSFQDERIEERHVEPILAWSSRPDKQRLVHEARRFLFDTLARRFLWLWQAKALRAGRRQQDLLQVASNHDKRTLLKQSLGQMRDAVADNKFWMQQARRAQRARDLFLLTKAFTHWAQAASDEVLRTNLAKRQVSRTRYFNAWRDITAVNELKCRRFVLLRIFPLWRAKVNARSQDEERAIAVREQSLLKSSYWHWFWAFCGRKAPVWKDIRLQSHSLGTMSAKFAVLQEMSLAAAGQHNHSLQTRCLSTLKSTCLWHQDHEVIAYSFRRRSLASRILDTMRRKTKFRPREVRLIVDYDVRLVRKAFLRWQILTRMTREASLVSERRILENAWSSWNDHLRLNTLRTKIEDRVTVQALYKWVLEERCSLLIRVMQHRQQASILHHFRSQLEAKRFQLNESLQMMQAFKARQELQFVMVKLHQQHRLAEQRESAAVEFRNMRDLPRSMTMWKENSAQALRLTRWATEARFYTLTHRAIQRWRAATVVAQKQRRRDAYASFRRNHKMRLAKRCLYQLHNRAAFVQSLSQEAVETRQHHDQDLCLNIVDQWFDRAMQSQENEQAAHKVASQRLLRLALQELTSKRMGLAQRDLQAQTWAQAGLDRAASKILRRFGDVVFILRRQVDTAEAWQIRKFSQHRQTMLRYWAARAKDLRASAAGDPNSPSKRASRRSRIGNDSLLESTDPTLRAEQWTQFDDTEVPPGDQTGIEQSTMDFTATPIPGYLRTPSRRAGRSRARTKSSRRRSPESRAQEATEPEPLDFGSSAIASTTPAALAPGNLSGMESLTPQVTPFQRKLRAGGYQARTTPLSLFRRGLDESRVYAGPGIGPSTGRSVRFEAGATGQQGKEEGGGLFDTPR